MTAEPRTAREMMYTEVPLSNGARMIDGPLIERLWKATGHSEPTQCKTAEEMGMYIAESDTGYRQGAEEPPPGRAKSLPRVTLRTVNTGNPCDLAELWALLRERGPHESISHRAMPTWAEHVGFVRSSPYKGWWLIDSDLPQAVGSVYLTHQGEIGLAIFRLYRERGYATAAVRAVMQMHPGTRFLANVNPANAASRALWESLGGKVVQVTYEIAPLGA